MRGGVGSGCNGRDRANPQIGKVGVMRFRESPPAGDRRELYRGSDLQIKESAISGRNSMIDQFSVSDFEVMINRESERGKNLQSNAWWSNSKSREEEHRLVR